MSAYNDGFNNYQHSPPWDLGESERIDWLRGQTAAKAEASKQESFGGGGGALGAAGGGLGLVFVVILAFIWAFCMVVWEKIKYFVNNTKPTYEVLLTITICSLIVYWLFKRKKIFAKILSIALAIVSLLFVKYWVGILRFRGFSVVIYDLIGLILFIVLGISFFQWVKVKMHGKWPIAIRIGKWVACIVLVIALPVFGRWVWWKTVGQSEYEQEQAQLSKRNQEEFVRFKKQQAIDLRVTDSIVRVNEAKRLSQPKEAKLPHTLAEVMQAQD
jgi:hypothetical protein